MKLKHIMTTLGLALVLGVGAGAGLASKQQVKEAKAASGDLTSVTLKGSFDGWGDGIAFVKQENGDYTLTHSLDLNVQFKVLVKGESQEDKWVGHNWSISADNIDYDYIGNDGENFKVTSAQSFVFTVKSTFYTNYGADVTIKKNTAVTVTVTKYAVLDGVLQAEAIGSDVEEKDAVYAVPDGIHRAGYHFVGWYTNEACTDAYTAGALAANLNLYAKYTSLVADSYIYYVTGSEADTTNYIYTFGVDEQFGAWPGKAITAVAGVEDVHGVLAFQGTQQKVYKIPVTSTADTHVILHTNSGTQTPNMTLTAGVAYWLSDEADANAKAGLALDLLLKVEAARNAVVASEGILAYSVCGIAPAKAAELYNEYYALEDKDVYVDSTTTWTYNGSYSNPAPEEAQISYYDIMQQLKAIAVKGGQTVSGAKVNTTVNSNNSMIIIVLVSSMSLIAISALFIIRRRRAMR